MHSIQLTDAQKPLVTAAIRLGDWLLSLDNLPEQAILAIKQTQTALQLLPQITADTMAMYGVSIEQGDDQQGLIRGWDISLECIEADPNQQAGLEIFSSYLPIPKPVDEQSLAEKKQHEVYFHWPLAAVCSTVEPTQSQRWIEEVTNPLQSAQPGDRLRVEVVYQQSYFEFVFPLR